MKNDCRFFDEKIFKARIINLFDYDNKDNKDLLGVISHTSI